MRLNEILTEDKGIFSTFNEWNAELYASWFTDTAAHYDNYVLYNYGDRLASKWFETNKDRIADPLGMVFATCADAWKKSFAALTAEYSVASPYSYKETESGTTETKATDSDTTVNSEKPYNATDFVGVEKTDNDTDNTATTTRTTTKERTGSNGEDISERILKELDLRRRRFTDMFIQDVINYIALSIYE